MHLAQFIKHKYFTKTSIVIIIALILLSPFTYLSFPKKVEAVTGCQTQPPIDIIDPMLVPVDDQSFGDRQEKRQNSEAWFKNCWLDSFAKIIAKELIKNLTMSIVTWINTGFEGNPSFIQNPGKFFEGIGDRVAGQMIERIAPFLCSPFKLELTLLLALEYSIPSGSAELDPVCTLTQIEDNIEGFVDSADVAANGWQRWFNVTQKQVNNPDGALIRARSQINAGISNTTLNLERELGWAEGFLSFKTCSGDTKGNNAPVAGVSPNQANCYTTTPGGIIYKQLDNVISSDLRGLEIAESFDQIFAALVGQLMTQALGGAGGLLGSDKNPDLETPPSIKLPPGMVDVGSCYPNTPEVAVGDSVIWEYVPSQSINSISVISQSWSGTNKLTGNGTSTVKTYLNPGTKEASLTITFKNKDRNTGAPIGSNIKKTIQCVPVSVVDPREVAPELSCIVSMPVAPINAQPIIFTIVDDESEQETVRYSHTVRSSATVVDRLLSDKELRVTYPISGQKLPVTITAHKRDGSQLSVNCTAVTILDIDD